MGRREGFSTARRLSTVIAVETVVEGMKVVEAQTGSPVAGANVLFLGTAHGAAPTDAAEDRPHRGALQPRRSRQGERDAGDRGAYGFQPHTIYGNLWRAWKVMPLMSKPEFLKQLLT